MNMTTNQQPLSEERVKELKELKELYATIDRKVMDRSQDFFDTLEKIYKDKLQAAEQQLGQVREEVKHLRTYVGLGEDEKVLSAKPNQMFIQRYGSKINISPYTDENNNLREALNDVQQWAESALTSDLVTGEVEDAFEQIEKRASDALSATPSDGCGKGRTLSSRLPDEQGLWWWQSDGESAPVAVHIAFSGCGGDYFATIRQYGWTEPQSVKDMGGLWLKAVEPRMVPFHEFEEAASSNGKDGEE